MKTITAYVIFCLHSTNSFLNGRRDIFCLFFLISNWKCDRSLHDWKHAVRFYYHLFITMDIYLLPWISYVFISRSIFSNREKDTKGKGKSSERLSPLVEYSSIISVYRRNESAFNWLPVGRKDVLLMRSTLIINQ